LRREIALQFFPLLLYRRRFFLDLALPRPQILFRLAQAVGAPPKPQKQNNSQNAHHRRARQETPVA